jgi:hypothetical protein
MAYPPRGAAPRARAPREVAVSLRPHGMAAGARRAGRAAGLEPRRRARPPPQRRLRLHRHPPPSFHAVGPRPSQLPTGMQLLRDAHGNCPAQHAPPEGPPTRNAGHARRPRRGHGHRYHPRRRRAHDSRRPAREAQPQNARQAPGRKTDAPSRTGGKGGDRHPLSATPYPPPPQRDAQPSQAAPPGEGRVDARNGGPPAATGSTGEAGPVPATAPLGLDGDPNAAARQT